jgi:hypothetical protein
MESVPVVEAVLTDVLIEEGARAMAQKMVALPWELIREAVQDSYRSSAREALRAAGFVESGQNQGGE